MPEDRAEGVAGSEFAALTTGIAMAVSSGRVTLAGDFDASNRAQVIEVFTEAVHAGSEDLLVDLTEVSFCSAALLSALSGLHEACVQRDIRVRVVPSWIVWRALRATGMDAVLTVADE
ncbi:STAS domain-containing protein [Amycolatopsis sp. NPDC004378]